MTLLLTASYGHDSWSGAWLSLRAEGAILEDWLRTALGAFGCEHSRHDKIIGLLRTSGRYDCMVQTQWFQRQFQEVSAMFDAAGVRLLIDQSYKSPFRRVGT
jgi:hypothetical protein